MDPVNTEALSRADVVDLIRTGKRARRRRELLEKFITRLLVSAVTSFIGGWEFMLAVGIMHRQWWPALPTIGYWWAVLVVVLLRGTFSYSRSTQKAATS